MRSALAPLLALAGACRGSTPPGEIVDVYAFAGVVDPAVGASVVAHRADGTPIDTVITDATGHAGLVIEDGALVTVVFPGDAPRVVTTLAPAPGSELDIHGPRVASTPTVAGVLSVTPQTPLAADTFDIELGCTLTRVTSLPTSLDVSSACAGSDSNVDILVRADQGGQLVGYAAGRVDLSEGAATFAPPTWQTSAPGAPITTTGVAPSLGWVTFSDGLPFGAVAVTTSAPLWTGLAIDSAILRATIATGASSQITTYYFAGAPAAIAIAAGDFLPAITPSLAFDASTTTFTWTASAVPADAGDLRLDWDAGSRHISWDAVLPPDVTTVTLPMFGGDLAAMIPSPSSPPDPILRYVVAATGPAGFDALLAAGLRIDTNTIVAPPIAGNLSETRASGYAP